MRTLTVLLAAAALALGAARAQTDDARTQAITDRYLTTVEAELTRNVDSKTATVGQEVTARTRRAAKLADGTALPAGTQLVGHIVSVQAQDKDNGRSGSLLAIAFDRAELKGGQSLRVRAVMQAVAPIKPQPPSQFDAMGASTTTLTPGMGPGAGAGGGMGSGAGGGGLGPGTAGGVGSGGVAGAGPADGGVGGMGTGRGGMGDGGALAGAARSLGRIPGTVGDSASAETGATTRSTGGPVMQAGESLSPAPRMTGLPGVWLSMTATANASGTLIAPGQSISLNAGTQITLGVILR